MIQPEPEDLPKDNPKLEIAVLSRRFAKGHGGLLIYEGGLPGGGLPEGGLPEGGFPGGGLPGGGLPGGGLPGGGLPK
ncbi:hypothetical protein Tco_1563899 [Tanacetum coccineum]